MLRLLAALLAVAALAVSARAGELPRAPGMYITGPAPAAPAETALPMLASQIDVRIRGPIVEATVTQTFRNDRDQPTEATYIFPLPDDAAVSAMAIETGARTIHAAIARRQDAQRRYEQAIAAGLGAGLLDQERPDVFTQTVSAIPAHGTVRVTLRFDTTARYEAGTWQLVLPLVVAPRFVPGTASGRPTTGTGRSPDTERAPDASRVTPAAAPGAGGATAIALAFADPVDDVTSPTHELQRDGARYTLLDPHSDHDVVVRWRASVASRGWVEQDDGGGYAAVVVEAPPPAAHAAIPSSLLLVLDRAATTRGDGDVVEHPLVRELLGALSAGDRVAVTGSDHISSRAPDQVLRALDDAWPRPAGALDLTRVLAATHANGAAVVLVSDGLVADDRAAIAAARAVGAPVHVIGIGPSPNRSLLDAIAHTTGGTVRFALPGDDLGALAHDVLADAASPPASLAVTWGTLAVSDVVPANLPRVGAGQAVLVVARVRKAERANARARGDVFALGTVAAPQPAPGATSPLGPIARRWARMKLDELIASGDRAAIEAHALRYGLVSPATSMVAIGEQVVVQGGVKHTVAVPVSVPAGMRWQDVQRQTEVETADDGRATGHLGGDERAKEKAPATLEPAEQPPEHRPTTSTPAGGEPEPEVAARQERVEDDDSARAPSPEADEETVDTTGAVLVRRERHRLVLALGAGAAIEHGSGALATALTLRYGYYVTGLTVIGADGGLWLVGGELEGTALATLTRVALPGRLELGGGLGVHAGGGLGPALDLELREPWPRHRLGLFLRYDGALLFHDGTDDGQHAATVGIDARW